MSDDREIDYSHQQLWRSGLEPKLNLLIFQIDGSIVAVIVAALILPKGWWTYSVPISYFVFCCYLAWRKITVQVFFRKLKSNIAGRYRNVGNYKLRKKRFNNER